MLNAGKRLDMQSILQLVINGCASGFIYFLVAFEITIIYNSSGLMNFSHEKFIILGAYMRIALVCGTDSNIHSGTDRSKMSRLFYQEAGSA